jgi:hypothetical protein
VESTSSMIWIISPVPASTPGALCLRLVKGSERRLQAQWSVQVYFIFRILLNVMFLTIWN